MTDRLLALLSLARDVPTGLSVPSAEYMVLARAYLQLGDTGEGRHYLQLAHKLVRLEPYEEASTNAALYSMLAELFLLDGDVEKARASYGHYLERMERAFGPSHVATSDCYNVLAAFFIFDPDLLSH